MADPLLGFPSHRHATVFTASSAAAGYPASQLGKLPLSKPWRSASRNPASCVISGELPALSDLRLMVAGPHNIKSGGTHRLRMWYDVPYGELAWDSGWLKVWPAVFTEDQVDWDGGRWWDRTYSADEIAGYPWYLPVLIPQEAGYSKAFTWEFDDSVEGSVEEYIEIGIVEPAGVIQMPYSAASGAQYGYETRSEIQEADGGTIYGRMRREPRMFEGVFQFLNRDFAKGRLMEMRRLNSNVIPFFWWQDYENDIDTPRDAYMARLMETSSLATYVSGACSGVDNFTLNIKELL